MAAYTLFVIILISWTISVISSDDIIDFKARPFRLEKFNFAWEKAQLRLDDIDSQKLFIEMSKLDKESLKAKHDYGSGKDPHANLLDKSNKKFENLLKQFELDDVLMSLSGKKSVEDDVKRVNDNYHKKFHGFTDPTINRLWQDAKSSGFSDSELADLYLEFQHYNEKREKFRELEQEINNFGNDDNSLNHGAHDDEQIDTNNYQDKSKKLKMLYKDADENYDNLVKKVENEKIRSAGGEFTHPKVKVLWENALKMQDSGKISSEDLNLLKEEMKHFDIKLGKLAFVEVEMVKNKYNSVKRDKEHLKSPEQKDLEGKYKEYERNVEKMEKYLKSKLIHTEL